jgi:hypothetical protein
LAAKQSGMAGVAAAPMPLQPPARQMGMPAFIPPQQMPFTQFNPQSQFNPQFQQFQAMPFQYV